MMQIAARVSVNNLTALSGRRLIVIHVRQVMSASRGDPGLRRRRDVRKCHGRDANSAQPQRGEIRKLSKLSQGRKLQTFFSMKDFTIMKNHRSFSDSALTDNRNLVIIASSA